MSSNTRAFLLKIDCLVSFGFVWFRLVQCGSKEQSGDRAPFTLQKQHPSLMLTPSPPNGKIWLGFRDVG